jgi:hypothetical protein
VFNLFDILRTAQGGAAFDNMARQFGLSAEQAQRAAEALLPAFALGLQRNAANPANLGALMGMLASDRYGGFFDKAGTAFSAQAREEGNEIIDNLFGSKDVSRQIAEQAALWSGVGARALQEMMPIMAAILVGGMAKAASAQGFAAMFGPFADLFRNAPTPDRTAAAQNPMEAWQAMMRSAMAGQGEQATAPAGTEGGVDPWQAMMAAMMRGEAQKPAEPPPEPEPPPPPDPNQAWERLFQAGQDVQEQQLNALRNILDQTWGAGTDRR